MVEYWPQLSVCVWTEAISVWCSSECYRVVGELPFEEGVVVLSKRLLLFVSSLVDIFGVKYKICPIRDREHFAALCPKGCGIQKR